MDIKSIAIQKPENVNFILGQSHFIKTVEDLHETLVSAVPGIKFGLAFCEASGKCLVRWSGTDEAMIKLLWCRRYRVLNSGWLFARHPANAWCAGRVQMRP